MKTKTIAEVTKHPEELIRKSFRIIWNYAIDANDKRSDPLMRIPADRNRDADFILTDAINELMEYRNQPSSEWQLITILRKLQDAGCPEVYSIEIGKDGTLFHADGFVVNMPSFKAYETLDESIDKLKQLLSKEGA